MAGRVLEVVLLGGQMACLGGGTGGLGETMTQMAQCRCGCGKNCQQQQVQHTPHNIEFGLVS